MATILVSVLGVGAEITAVEAAGDTTRAEAEAEVETGAEAAGTGALGNNGVGLSFKIGWTNGFTALGIKAAVVEVGPPEERTGEGR